MKSPAIVLQILRVLYLARFEDFIKSSGGQSRRDYQANSAEGANFPKMWFWKGNVMVTMVGPELQKCGRDPQ